MEGYEYQQGKNSRDVKPVIENTENAGITLRSIEEVFKQAAKANHGGSKKITIQASFLQIYNEKVYDLLNVAQSKEVKQKGLKIRWNK